MLFVFQVDTGTMMTFDMRLAMESVINLKRAIASKTDIPEDKQVLLISGGESLNNMQRICSYSSAGTDTSPIFLFAKVNIESYQPTSVGIDVYNDDRDMTDVVESCMNMQPSLDTLVARTELAADLSQQAFKQKEICERLIYDQHLQQQGWAAVTANLEDLTRAFKNKAEMLITAFEEFIKEKPNFEKLLHEFGNDMKYLDNIPVLRTLIEESKTLGPLITSNLVNNQSTSDKLKFSPISNQQSTEKVPTSENTPDDSQKSSQIDDSGDNRGSGSTQKSRQSNICSSNSSDETPINLRQWIDCHDSQNSLERLIELCWQGLERFTEANAEQIRFDVQELLKAANNTQMKKIGLLEERFFGLEKLMMDARRVVEDQNQLASSFQNHRESFSKAKDNTVLPDLSKSHKPQLELMLSNHKKICDYRSRCVRAKQELSENLLGRLKWIVYIEQKISDLDGRLMIYKENLMRLQRHLEVANQVHKSPGLYLEAVVEASRRRRFSRQYLHWANSIARISKEIHEREMNNRREFDAKLNNHFLSNLFPGMTRTYPPPFATTAPDPFDTKLPRVTAVDIQFLQSKLCDELAQKLHVPNDTPMPHIISAPSNLEDSVQREEITDLDDRHSLNPTPPSSPTRQGC